ncbi:MAG TPA: POTRA domain-containing protein [Terracidiphilus sp.]|nr:POTRA domain-containing protein [Terracidiphilus sp.]
MRRAKSIQIVIFSIAAAILLMTTEAFSSGQTPEGKSGTTSVSSPTGVSPEMEHFSPSAETLGRWEGLPVRRIVFEGVPESRLGSLPGHLAQAEGKPLTRRALRESLRQLFSTGVYDTLAAEGRREGDQVDLLFRGTARTFIGTVGVYGAKGATVNTQLASAAQLSPGTRFTQAKLDRAMQQMRDALAQDGYYEPSISQKQTPQPADQLTDIVFRVESGPQSRVGSVEVNGDAGMSAAEFRRVAGLRSGAHVTRDSVSRALSRVLKHYQLQNRMEAEIKLVSEKYVAAGRKVNFNFSVTRGPVVTVSLEGANMEEDDLKRLIPIYTEGTVDEDLLNEGNRRLRDYFQRQGYFDVKVDHRREAPRPDLVEIVYNVQLGERRKVAQVSVEGNHYFDAQTLKDLLSVHAAGKLDPRGTYSQGLVAADVSALESVYQNNGFADVKVTPEVINQAAGGKSEKDSGTEPLRVVYSIDEGRQLRVGAVTIEGNEHIESSQLASLLNTTAGQLLSPQNLGGDRDALLTAYMNRGFDRVQVSISQKPEAKPGESDPDKVDVTFSIDEGPQVFVRNVLLSGLHYTRPTTVTRAVVVQAGDPLNPTALTDTQRNLYDLGLFSQVNAAVQNPTGEQREKTVLLQATEARRWTLTYGFGFEAQTGQPQKNCRGEFLSGIPCSPAGKTGVSPRVLADITRNNLFGRAESASVQGTYGLLEQSVNLLFQIPHFEGNRNIGLTFSGGYANSQDVTTYVASRLESGFRFTQNFQSSGSRFSRANTFVYEYDFRRVKVAASSLQVCPCDLTELSTASRVAGPSFTWIRDTRDSPLDAHRGTYTSFQDFASLSRLGADAEFNRIDVSNASYYSFDKNRFVLARNTRYGQVRSFGAPANELIPLPERLYAGGALSLRAFGQNAAGPRDPETGYPVGGAGTLINQTEMRFPSPSLPWVGDSLSFVLFHDMGNVFANAGDAWVSAIRIHQPDRDVCKQLATVGDASTYDPSGPVTSTGPQGQCDFNYFTHAPGIGLRYHTPVGPLRLDFSYNLNPPIFPININYSLVDPASNPHVGEAAHFNFFFSFGQAF